MSRADKPLAGERKAKQVAKTPGLSLLCGEGKKEEDHYTLHYPFDDQVLECYDWVTGQWTVLTEKPDWVFGAELAAADGRLFTLGGVASR